MKKCKGISLIEILISIAIIGGAIAVFATLFSILKINKTGTFYAQGYKLAGEEMEAVRALPFSGLGVRTNTDFINVLYNKNVLGAFESALGISGSGTSMGIAVLPTDRISDFTLEANVKADSLTQKSGFLFRARDLENYYFLYITSDKIALQKKVNNTLSTLHESASSFSQNIYYKLKVEATGSNISLYLNGGFVGSVSDDDISSGYIALASSNNLSYFDDVNIDGTIWDFNDTPLNELPDSWKRFGINDLPNGSGTLSISEPYNDASLKQIDISVSWTERDGVKTINLSSLRAE